MAKIRTNNSPPIHLGSPFDTSGADDADRPHPSNKLADALLLAMANGQLRLHYQPIIDVATDRITGLEALLRWEHPAWGTLLPRRFIAVAEQSGLMADIGDWVIRRACQDLCSWADSGCTGVRVEINISTSQFRDPLHSPALSNPFFPIDRRRGCVRARTAKRADRGTTLSRCLCR